MTQHAICTAVKQNTPGVKSFFFKSNEKLLFSPGQFITLSLPTMKGCIQRSYTLSSSPENNNTFSITVRKVQDGKGSHWLHHNFQPGNQIEYSGPYGRFTPDRFEQKKLLFLEVSGSGDPSRFLSPAIPVTTYTEILENNTPNNQF